MFAELTFEDQVYRSSLRFRNQELESAFQERAEYFNGKVTTYLILGADAAALTFTLAHALIEPMEILEQRFRAAIIISAMYFFGPLCELLIFTTGRLTCLRTTIQCISYFVCVSLNIVALEPVPNFHPS